MTDQAMGFTNGLSPEHDDAIDDLMIDLVRINQRIDALGRHRSYSLAQTKLEEAIHWKKSARDGRSGGWRGYA